MTPKERPILMSAPMVRALLAGTKTQTRRAVKPKVAEWIRCMSGEPDEDEADVTFNYASHIDDDGKVQPPEWLCLLDDYPDEGAMPIGQCPYGQPGDRLWVREAWQHHEGGQIHDAAGGVADSFDPETVYKASRPNYPGPWKPSIHMPRWASRITLEVTGVRVERLQDISEADAVAEGVIECDGLLDEIALCHRSKAMDTPATESRVWYAELWESINGPGSWDANPWVWVVEFSRLTPA